VLSIRRGAIVVHHKRHNSGDTKTGGHRSIVLDPHTVARLKAWKARQSEEQLACKEWNTAEGDLIFTLSDGRGHHPEAVSIEFKRKQDAFNKANPDNPLPRMSLHCLRHTHATHAFHKGIHPKSIQDRLGHRSNAVTLDMYSHLVEGVQGEVANELAADIYSDELNEQR
jgi:integrase